MVIVNIGRKEAIFFGVVILVFVVAGLAVAYGGTNPAVMGHSANELARCGANQVLKMDSTGTNWTCASDATGVATLTCKVKVVAFTGVGYGWSGGCDEGYQLTGASCEVGPWTDVLNKLGMVSLRPCVATFSSTNQSKAYAEINQADKNFCADSKDNDVCNLYLKCCKAQ